MLFIAIGLSFHYFLVRDLGLENSDITIVTILYPQSKVLSFWQLLTNEYRQLFSSFLNFKLMSMASRYCQKSSSFLNVSKIPQYISRYSYNWSSFPYRVFSFTLSLSRSRREIAISTKTQRDEEISTKTQRDFVHHRDSILRRGNRKPKAPWALITFFAFLGGRLFEEGANSRLGAN